MRALRAWAVIGLLAAGGAIGIACSIDESGLAPPDGSLVDVIGDGGPPSDGPIGDVANDVPLPPTCPTTDLSCFGLDGGLPEGWSPYLYEPDGGACPSNAYAAKQLVTNTQLTGGCACSCTGTGSWTCPPTADLTGGMGPTCNPGFVVIEAGVCQNVVAFGLDHIEQTQTATAVGSALACDAGTPSAPVVTSDQVTLCGASCDAGASAVCGASGGRACIAADGVQPACPGSLTRIVVGGSADPSCNACSCTTQTNAPTCAATAHLYWTGGDTDIDCDDAGTEKDLGLTSACQPAGHKYDSYFFTWNDAGAVGCTPGGGGGDAGLASPKTLCCAN